MKYVEARSPGDALAGKVYEVLGETANHIWIRLVGAPDTVPPVSTQKRRLR